MLINILAIVERYCTYTQLENKISLNFIIIIMSNAAHHTMQVFYSAIYL